MSQSWGRVLSNWLFIVAPFPSVCKGYVPTSTHARRSLVPTILLSFPLFPWLNSSLYPLLLSPQPPAPQSHYCLNLSYHTSHGEYTELAQSGENTHSTALCLYFPFTLPFSYSIHSPLTSNSRLDSLLSSLAFPCLPRALVDTADRGN